MNSSQVEINLKTLINTFDKETFIYELLVGYGISRTTVTRLKKGDFNLSKVPGEVLYKKKVLFKEVLSHSLLTTIDEITKNEESLKHNPRFVIVTDFKTLLSKDTRTGLTLDIPILEIDKHFHFFLPWTNSEFNKNKIDTTADRNASYEMAKLYDILVYDNPNIYEDGGHNLNIFLSRILFCFFAEDTNIFRIEGLFTDTLAKLTNPNGNDVDSFLDRIFLKLNTEFENDAPDFLKDFPYVNGGLFNDNIKSPKFSSKARKIILQCGNLNWSEINPDIFGSMLQAVVRKTDDDNTKHYTSVPNIMKVIDPLFLDELNEEFEKSKGSLSKLKKLIHRLSKIKVFDPACGSGNFLIIAYKALRSLEINILQQINELETQKSIVFTEIKLSQFYGVELDDFAHEMAILSLWLAEHQMNNVFKSKLHDFGKSKPILPLKEAGHITLGNAAILNWEYICPKQQIDEVYILGNPPYAGSRNQSKEQKDDMKFVFKKDYKSLDYVSCWFYKGAEYIRGINAKLALVSTNSICQGEQVALIWPRTLSNNIEIGFAYQSIKWTNNAKGNAGVSFVIIGLRNESNKEKLIYTNNLKKIASNISPYLIDTKTIYIKRTPSPISIFPTAVFGNMPNDGGNLLLNEIEKNELIDKYPQTIIYIKEFIGAHDFISNKKRWCLLIDDDELEEAMKNDIINKRLNNIKSIREKSTEISTREKAKTPNHFYFFSHQNTESILIPRHTSENREYIPIGFYNSETIIADSALAIYDAKPWIFGVISSIMHMAWVRAIGGKLKTDYRYSSGLCYNTFPFPAISEKQRENINLHVFAILEEREKYPEKSLSQLYAMGKMPKGLKEAHHELDLAIERCYRLKPFESDVERLEYLLKLFEDMTTKNSLAVKPLKSKKIK